jgi:hypothetical protein
VQNKSRHTTAADEIKAETTTLLSAADDLSVLMDNLPSEFKRVKLELVGGEVSIFDLAEIIKRIKSERLYRVQLTTNFMRPADYYKNLASYLAGRGVELTMTASWHSEYLSSGEYFSKAAAVAPVCKIFSCEEVSTAENQAEVKSFRAKCEELSLFYLIDADIRIGSAADRAAGLIQGGNAERNIRYTVKYWDDSCDIYGEETYRTRNEFVTDTHYAENRLCKIILTYGMICTQSWDYVYIDADQAVGRTAASADCKNRMPIKDFRSVKPCACQSAGCTLCGQMSLSRSPAARP